jgi:hypothetical protein
VNLPVVIPQAVAPAFSGHFGDADDFQPLCQRDGKRDILPNGLVKMLPNGRGITSGTGRRLHILFNPTNFFLIGKTSVQRRIFGMGLDISRFLPGINIFQMNIITLAGQGALGAENDVFGLGQRRSAADFEVNNPPVPALEDYFQMVLGVADCGDPLKIAPDFSDG